MSFWPDRSAHFRRRGIAGLRALLNSTCKLENKHLLYPFLALIMNPRVQFTQTGSK